MYFELLQHEHDNTRNIKKDHEFYEGAQCVDSQESNSGNYYSGKFVSNHGKEKQ